MKSAILNAVSHLLTPFRLIVERIIYLLRMNIQLLFIFDGPDKPPKQWPSEYSYTESNIRLLKELLDHLGVPHHDAPGEAAAECVRLQDLGIVDAVWTDNTDALMFGGSPTLVQFHKKPEGDQFKNTNTVLVTSAAGIKERLNLTREWFLMYATLVGCGYTSGLDGFTPARFLRFAQHGCFQAAANLLAAAVETPLVLSKWRIVVRNIIIATFPDEVDNVVTAPPKTFPDLDVLRGCAHPSVSPDPVLRDLPCLRDGWFRPYGPDMLSRYRFLLHNFNTQIHESWVARDLVPIELNHRLRETPTSSPTERAANRRFALEIRPKRKETPSSTVTVDPLRVLPELLSAFPSEMYRVVNGARVRIEPPVFRPEETELLDCVLRRGLPEGSMPKRKQPPPPLPQTPSRDIVAIPPSLPTPTPSTPTAAAIAAKRRPPPVPGARNDNISTSSNYGMSRSFPTQGRLADRMFRPSPIPMMTPPRAAKSGLPVLPPINTHLPLPLHNIDTTSSPTCIHFHEGLTLPGELDWHNPPLTSPLPLSPLPVSRRASALVGKLSGPEYGVGVNDGRRRSVASISSVPLPTLRQPAWDYAAEIDLPELD